MVSSATHSGSSLSPFSAHLDFAKARCVADYLGNNWIVLEVENASQGTNGRGLAFICNSRRRLLVPLPDDWRSCDKDRLHQYWSMALEA